MEKKRSSDFQSASNSKFDTHQGELQAYRLELSKLMLRVDTLEKNEKVIRNGFEELQGRLNIVQEQQQGAGERVSKLYRELNVATGGIHDVSRHILSHAEDIAALREATANLQISKAESKDLDVKADLKLLESKASLQDVHNLTEDIEKMEFSLHEALEVTEAKMKKRFSKLSNFTVKQLRLLPSSVNLRELSNDDGSGGIGRLKCLVCDHPIKTLEGGPPYKGANFYNTVGMLRYRRAEEERETLSKQRQTIETEDEEDEQHQHQPRLINSPDSEIEDDEQSEQGPLNRRRSGQVDCVVPTAKPLQLLSRITDMSGAIRLEPRRQRSTNSKM